MCRALCGALTCAAFFLRATSRNRTSLHPSSTPASLTWACVRASARPARPPVDHARTHERTDSHLITDRQPHTIIIPQPLTTLSYRHGPVSVWESAGRSGSATSGAYREWRAFLSQRVCRWEYRLADRKEPRPVRGGQLGTALWVIKSPLGSSRPVRGGALAARDGLAWQPEAPGFWIVRSKRGHDTARRRASRCPVCPRDTPPWRQPSTRHASFHLGICKDLRVAQPGPLGVRAAGSSPRAAARRERVRVRQVVRGVRSSLATVAGLIPALAASCSWDRPCWRRDCRNRWPSRAMFQR